MYRIEALQPGVVDAVRKYGSLSVNGFRFAEVDGRVLSEPLPESQVGLFDVPGYLLVRADPPYERVSELGAQTAIAQVDAALREGSLPPEEALKAAEGAQEAPLTPPKRRR